MKNNLKFLLTATLAVITVSASAQLGVKAGYVNSATKVKSENITVSPDTQNGFYAGVNYDIGLPVKGLSIRPGVTYTFISGKSLYDYTINSALGIIGDTQKQ